jgi:hypothetical protein
MLLFCFIVKNRFQYKPGYFNLFYEQAKRNLHEKLGYPGEVLSFEFKFVPFCLLDLSSSYHSIFFSFVVVSMISVEDC